MTTIKIFKKKDRTIGIKVSGHSGYGEEGTDIVCASISSLAQMVCVGLENVLKLNVGIKIDDGYLECFLPEDLDGETLEKAQVLFDSFEQSVELLLVGDKTLKKYIKLEVKNEIY